MPKCLYVTDEVNWYIEEVALVANRPAVSLPVDNVRSRLAEEALNAALGLLKKKQPREKLFQMSTMSLGVVRNNEELVSHNI